MSLSYGFVPAAGDEKQTSAQFSEAMNAVTGNGIGQYGKQFALSVNGFTVTVNTGFALIAGRYVKNDESLRCTVPLPGNYDDRTDAVVLRVNYEERRILIEIIPRIDELEVRYNPPILRGDGEYCCVLYFVRVKRNATSIGLSDITDVRGNKALCGWIMPLSKLTKGILEIYQYVTGGIDEDVNRITAAAAQLVEQTDTALRAVQDQLSNTNVSNSLGDLQTGRRTPAPAEEWLLCNGEQVPEEYAGLKAVIGKNLPNISAANDRYRTYIYSGKPSGGDE